MDLAIDENDSDDDGSEFVRFDSYLNSLLKIHEGFGQIRGVEYATTDRWEIMGDGIGVDGTESVCAVSEYQSVFGAAVAEDGVHRWSLRVVRSGFHILWNCALGVLRVAKSGKE